MTDTRRTTKRATIVVTLLATLVAAAVIVPPASAAFDQIKIREVLPGVSEYDPDGPEFVELQAFADGQNTVSGQVIAFYGPTGTVKGTFTIPNDVANGSTQRSILIGTEAFGGVTPDFTYPDPLLENDGGAVCYGNIDCVAWGSFSDPAPAPIIPQGRALLRSIAAGCATLLERSDDTDNSRDDFSLATPTPRNNATTPTETACGGQPPPSGNTPDTVITKVPKRKTTRRTAQFRFTSSEPGSTFECRLDNRRFRPCASPLSYGKDGKKLKRGRHSFEVMAISAGVADPTPARYSWRIKKKGRKKATS